MSRQQRLALDAFLVDAAHQVDLLGLVAAGHEDRELLGVGILGAARGGRRRSTAARAKAIASKPHEHCWCGG
jgi:hypothetical protein